MAPEYEKLVDIIKEKREDVVIARLEGSINEDISIIYEIFSFPKVVLFYPGSVDIRGNFRGQRIGSVMFNWIEQNAPKLEKKFKYLEEDKKEKKDDIVIKVANKTKTYDLEDAVNSGKNATGEVEFLKIEMLNMKNRIINLEKEIEVMKNHTINIINMKSNNSNDTLNNLSQEELSMRLKMIKDKKIIRDGVFEKISTFDILIYLGIFLFIIGAIITIKKILFKKTKSIIANDHAKV